MQDRDKILEMADEQKRNIDNLCEFFTPPTPDEVSALRIDKKKFSEFLSDTRNVLYLCEKFRLCKYCRRVSTGNTRILCEDSKRNKDCCYLRSLGVLSDSTSPADSVSHAALLSKLGDILTTVLYNQTEVYALEKALKEEQKVLDIERTVLEEKKSKLGRPSKLNSRRLLYDVYWVKVNPKPAVRELAVKLGISHTQVRRDLIELGLLEK